MRNNTHAKSVAATLCQAGIHWNFNLSKKESKWLSQLS